MLLYQSYWACSLSTGIPSPPVPLSKLHSPLPSTSSSGTSLLGPTKSHSQLLHCFTVWKRTPTYMLNDTPAFPPIPINNLPKRTRPVVQPALRVLERRAQGRNVLRTPDRRQYVPCRVEAILSSRVVVLDASACHQIVLVGRKRHKGEGRERTM
jgi:hypothetical protein